MAMIKRGTERTIANLSNHFIKDYEITIVTNINGPIEYKLDKRIKVIPIDKKNKMNEILPLKVITKTSPKRSKELIKIIEEEKPDLIITTLPEPTIRVLKIKKYYNIPIIVAIRNHPNSEFSSIIGKTIRNKYYKKANKIIIQDEHYKKYLPDTLQNMIKVIPNYISDEFTNNIKERKKEKKIITIASLEKQKNIPLLINAFANLDKKFSDYRLEIIGNGKEKNKIKNSINKKELQNRITLKETNNNIKEELLSSTLFVLTSNYEGMPNVLLEAMAIGLPVITTDSTDALRSFINGKNAIIVKKKNKKELIEKIEYLLNNEEKRHLMAKEASKIKKIYKKEIIIKYWEDIIKEELK